MNEPTMLYRCPGPESFEGVACETTIVDAPDVDAKLEEGWHRNWIDADQAHKDAAAKIAANEAEQAEIARKLAEAGGGKPALQAVHKGRGVWELHDAAGNVVEGGLTGEQAKAKAAASAG